MIITENGQTFDYNNLMSITKFMKKLKVSRQSLYNWMEQGRLKRITFLDEPWVDTSTLAPELRQWMDDRGKPKVKKKRDRKKKKAIA